MNNILYDYSLIATHSPWSWVRKSWTILETGFGVISSMDRVGRSAGCCHHPTLPSEQRSFCPRATARSRGGGVHPQNSYKWMAMHIMPLGLFYVIFLAELWVTSFWNQRTGLYEGDLFYMTDRLLYALAFTVYVLISDSVCKCSVERIFKVSK